MKNLFIIIILLLSFPLVTRAVATNSSYDNIKVYLFYEEENDSFNDMENYIEETLKDYQRIRLQLINTKEEKDLYEKIKDKLDIKKDDKPLIVLGSSYFLGNNVKTNLKDAFNAYEKSDNYCDLVTKIRNDEDINECLKINEEIYQVPSEVNYLIIGIILVTVVICFIIGIIIYQKKRAK